MSRKTNDEKRSRARASIMKIWIDGDACPVVIKEILFRAANRTKTDVTLVANQFMRLPPSPHIHFLKVPSGFDVADNEIVKRLEKSDLVITSDIPLADAVLEKGGKALSFRGEIFSPDSIKERLDTRDFLETLRSSGIQTGGPAALNQADRQVFGNALDKILQHK